MNTDNLFNQIKQKKSFLCVGLDPDFEKLPQHLKNEKFPVFEFNKQIVDATAEFSIAYKPNLAFYECRGMTGWQELELTVTYIRQNFPEIFLIADAKRGDIGNTSKMYAEAFFTKMDFDAVTVAPYMGEDSVKPFLKYPGKFAILLALTSNESAADFQYFTSKASQPLFMEVIDKSRKWGTPENLMYVVGATKANMLVKFREIVPDHFLLVPGIGAQGGSLEEVATYGFNKKCGLLVNASRSIIYAGTDKDFASMAAIEAHNLQQEMELLLKNASLIK
jgi:orotidine-5'-phosphate decarboxylase